MSAFWLIQTIFVTDRRSLFERFGDRTIFIHRKFNGAFEKVIFNRAFEAEFDDDIRERVCLLRFAAFADDMRAMVGVDYQPIELTGKPAN